MVCLRVCLSIFVSRLRRMEHSALSLSLHLRLPRNDDEQ